MRGGFGRRMTSGKETDFALSKLHPRAIQLVLNHFKRHAVPLLVALGSMVIVTMMSLAGPYLTKVAIDDYIVTGDLNGLTWIALLILLSYGVFWGGSFWQTFLSSWVAQRFIGDLRIQLYDHIQRQSIDFFHRRRTGDLLSRIVHDLETVSELVTSGFIHLLNDVLTLLGIAIILWVLDPPLALVTFFVLPPIAWIMNRLGKKMRQAYTEVRERLADLNVDVEESLSGIRVVQALNREAAKSGTFSRLSWDNLRANLRAASLFALLFPTMTISRVAGESLVLWYGGWRVVAGTLTLGVIIAFLGYVRRFFAPLAELSQIYNTLQHAGASLHRAVEILEEVPSVTEPSLPQSPSEGFKGEIVFDRVAFTYDQEQEHVLSGFDLSIKPGETFALVGPTGAGKTTVVNLLTRLYDPTEGAIRIDGIDLRAIASRDLRRIMAVVPQSVFLFNRSLRENIRVGRPQATDEEVETVAKLVGAHYFIRRLPDGYETRVGEGGSRLSGGQRQLIALARALLAQPRIMILDEATSSVDPHSERRIRQAMPSILQGKTALMIAHRLSTLESADRIGMIGEGQLQKIGTHRQLMQTSPLYRDLVKKQHVS